MPADRDGAVDGWPAEAVATVAELRTAVRELEERTRQLQHALDSRIVIEQAKGVLAERLSLTPDDSFALLRGAARSAQMPLHDLAAAVVSSSPSPEPVTRELARRDGAPAR